MSEQLHENGQPVSVGSTGGSACLFCDNERKLKPQCTKQRWMVCNDHFIITCPKCGHEGFWMENMKSGSYFACFSLACNWRSPIPPNDQEERKRIAAGVVRQLALGDCHVGDGHKKAAR